MANTFKNGTFWEFTKGYRALQVTNQNEWQKFVKLCKDNQLPLAQLNRIQNEGGYPYLNHINRINHHPTDLFLFERSGDTITWDSDIEKSTEWYGTEPLVFA